MCQYCVLISNSSPLDTHVAASSRLGIVFPPIREYLLGQAFCSRPSPWKGREGSQCAAPTLIPLACPPPPGLPTHINQYSPDLTGGHFCLHLLGHSLGAKYLESIFSEVKASEPCIPFISVYRKRPSVAPGFEPWKLVQLH